MASVNKVILVGNMTRDPQLKYLPSQTPVAEFGLAMNRRFKTASGEDREEVCFVDCTAFARAAEVINQYCQKGKLIYIEGRLKLDQWEDKQGGGKRSKLSVVVENFQFLGGREGGGRDAGPGGGEDQRPAPRQPQQNRAPAQTQDPAAPPQESPISEESQPGPSDIPF
ncbi:MAG: single-stranded DNA-binding protein [Tepidisphaeraceae bacterium]|jgi:single-strand DNA-binding protein